jgi:hypothetical protein
MTKRLDISSQEETLTNELTENLKEQHALQIRAQELQRRVKTICLVLKKIISLKIIHNRKLKV